MMTQAVQLRAGHPSPGIGKSSGEEKNDKPKRQPHIVPDAGHGSGDQEAGGDGHRIRDGGGPGGRRHGRPALLPRP